MYGGIYVLLKKISLKISLMVLLYDLRIEHFISLFGLCLDISSDKSLLFSILNMPLPFAISKACIL